MTRGGYKWLDGSDGLVDGITNLTFALKSSAWANDVAGFSRFTAAEITFTLNMMTAWSDVANVRFHRVGTGTTGDGAYSNNATILFSNYNVNDGNAAYAYMPGSTDYTSNAGDVYVNFNNPSSQNWDYMSYGALAIAHEFGHTLGLQHPGDYNSSFGGTVDYSTSAAYYEDSRQYTLMSYFDGSHTGETANIYASTPLMDDIAAMQKLYGANMTTRTGNTVYGFNSTADRDWFSASVNGVARSVVFCVWDAGGTDTFDFSGYGQNQTIDLRAGAFSHVGGLVGTVSIAAGAIIENGIGGAGADTLIGNAVVNTLIGGAGNDVLDGGLGADFLVGGLGDDRYIVDVSGDVITELANEGKDTVKAAFTYTLGATLENLTLTGTAVINGTGNTANSVLVGNAAANILTGLAGNDILDGGAGIDTMVGGVGDDVYIVDVTGDKITELANAGIDTVQSAATYILGVNIENLTLTGTAAINGTGNASNNSLTGNSAANILSGGLGSDKMAGGQGNDTYVVDAIGDLITELANEGTDLVQSSVTYSLAANVENLTLTGKSVINGTGNELNNILIGNAVANILTGAAGNDTLDGGAGIDRLIGGLGDDTYIVDVAGDVITELANEGTDTVSSKITYTLGANLENLILTGATAINGTGNAANNIITGNAAANILTGGAGNDVLDGGVGSDTLTGGTGDDTYRVDAIGDKVTELANEGIDTVSSTITYVLGTNLENLTLTGTAAINATGNTANNILIGNSAANVLNGGTGNDFLTGGGGKDTLTGGAGADAFIFTALTDSAVATPDLITDFMRADGDYIDLSALDANSTLAGDQAFSFVTAFSKQAGQATLSYNATTKTTTFSADVNGDGVADFVLQIAGQHDTALGWML